MSRFQSLGKEFGIAQTSLCCSNTMVQRSSKSRSLQCDTKSIANTRSLLGVTAGHVRAQMRLCVPSDNLPQHRRR